jgi:hypothetical protein
MQHPLLLLDLCATRQLTSSDNTPIVRRYGFLLMPDALQGIITIAEAKEALKRSGYLLESRVEKILRDEGYYVEANAAYPDPETGKSRELDVYGMGATKAGPNDYDYVFAVLLIECVNNLEPLAFITKEPLVGFLHHQEVKLAGLPVKIPAKKSRDSWEALPDFLGMDRYHHYCKGRVATQFCSFSRKKKDQEWMASHHPDQFESFRKLSAAVEYFIDRHYKSWRFGADEWLNVEFYYPLLLLQGQLLEARPSKRSLRMVRADHVQYRRSALIGREQVEYQIDVITEDYFPQYLKIVESEISKTTRLLRRRHSIVRKAIERIARAAKPLRSPEKIRAAMEM